MLKILANDGMANSAIKELESKGHTVINTHFDDKALVEKLNDVDVVVIRSKTKIRRDLIDQIAGGTLKLIVRAGVGIDNIDHQYAEENGIAVRNTPNSSSASVAELALAHMFALARHLAMANLSMRKGEWHKKQYKGIELNQKTLGLIGFGRIGREVAKKAAAIGMTVYYTNNSGPLADYPEYTYKTKEDLLKSSDFVSLHIPYVKEKGPAIAAKELAMMKDGAYLINCARGGVVDEAALLDALDSGKLSGAALDVFESEPTTNEAVFTHEKLSLTPHIGASTAEAQERIGFETIAVIEAHFNN